MSLLMTQMLKTQKTFLQIKPLQEVSQIICIILFVSFMFRILQSDTSF